MSNVLPFQPGAATLVDGDPTGVFAPAIVGHIAVDPSTGDTYVGIGTTSADWKPTGGGGGSQPVTRAQYGGDSVTIANGEQGLLKWSPYFGNDGETPLLDLTDPLNPTILEAGVYAITVVPTIANGGSFTVGGTFNAALALDLEGDDTAGYSAYSIPATEDNEQAINLPMQATYYLAAGAVLNLTVNNNDGVQDLDFAFDACMIQRLSGPAA